ncbi:MAG: DsbE family thiol:disulfide interchange protein [Pseudomonadota bacterium]
MPRLVLLIPLLVFAALAGLFAAGNFSGGDDTLPSTFVGRAAPPVALTPMAGRVPFSDATLRDGEVKLVNYWASWCAPCRVEHPNFTILADQGLPIYGINYKDDAGNAEDFLQELGDPYSGVAQDPTGRTALDWGVYGVPETYILDGDGTILARIAGPVTQRTFEAQMRPVLEAAGVTVGF